eukprot:gene8762-biopygen15193
MWERGAKLLHCCGRRREGAMGPVTSIGFQWRAGGKARQSRLLIPLLRHVPGSFLSVCAARVVRCSLTELAAFSPVLLSAGGAAGRKFAVAAAVWWVRELAVPRRRKCPR